MINSKIRNSLFELYPAQGQLKGILSIPHSGEELPEEFRQYLSSNTWDLMQDVDYKVHELVQIKDLQQAGITVIKSNIIRTAIDLNRDKESALLNWKKNSKGKQIVLKTPPEEIAESLTEKYYSPYYEMLKTLIYELQKKMEIASLVDLHSMPAKAEEYHLAINPHQDIKRPDFCLSDIEGQSCEKEFINFIANELRHSYSTVNINNPYFGGHVTRFLNAKYKNLNNIQIEISRDLYMNEKDKTLLASEVQSLKKHLTKALIKLFETYYQKKKIHSHL